MKNSLLSISYKAHHDGTPLCHVLLRQCALCPASSSHTVISSDLWTIQEFISSGTFQMSNFNNSCHCCDPRAWYTTWSLLACICSTTKVTTRMLFFSVSPICFIVVSITTFLIVDFNFLFLYMFLHCFSSELKPCLIYFYELNVKDNIRPTGCSLLIHEKKNELHGGISSLGCQDVTGRVRCIIAKEDHNQPGSSMWRQSRMEMNFNYWVDECICFYPRMALLSSPGTILCVFFSLFETPHIFLWNQGTGREMTFS